MSQQLAEGESDRKITAWNGLTQELLSRSSSSCDYGDYEVVFNKNHVYV